MSYRRYSDTDRSSHSGQKRRYDGDDRDVDRNRDDTDRHRGQTDGYPQKRREIHHDEPPPPLYTIFQGQVANVKDYGLFVRLQGSRRQGLVHKSQISQSRVEDASEMYSVGEEVYCKVIALGENGDKIELAMKNVNQTTGQDLDPNNIQLSQDEKKRRQWKHVGRQKIELDAVYDTTCKRCGGKGHLAQECFKAKGDDSYDLIPDLDEYMADMAKSKKAESACRKKKKKEKKHKKEKKKKRPRDRGTSSDTDSDSRHQMKDKKQNLKYKHRKSSTSDSDSDSKIETKSKKTQQKHSRRSSDSVTERQTKHKKRPSKSDSEAEDYGKYEKNKGHRYSGEKQHPIADRQIKHKKKPPSSSGSEAEDYGRYENTKDHRHSREIHGKHKRKKHRDRSYSSSSSDA